MFDGVFNIVFSPILGLNPTLSIFIISVIVSIPLTLINKKAMGSKEATEAKKKIEEARAKMLEAQKEGDTKRMNAHLQKLMEINSEYMRVMMKPMMISLVISFILILTIFPWLNKVYGGKVIATVPEILPIFGGRPLSWIPWYILTSITISLVLKKLLGI